MLDSAGPSADTIVADTLTAGEACSPALFLSTNDALYSDPFRIPSDDTTDSTSPPTEPSHLPRAPNAPVLASGRPLVLYVGGQLLNLALTLAMASLTFGWLFRKAPKPKLTQSISECVRECERSAAQVRASTPPLPPPALHRLGHPCPC